MLMSNNMMKFLKSSSDTLYNKRLSAGELQERMQSFVSSFPFFLLLLDDEKCQTHFLHFPISAEAEAF